ncbi:Serine/threonine protein kinase domain protein [Rhodopirellula maiorica SM1]|uniref:Serine/threonine protein kinase domain protein n=1 Tax=Rhodopirellula maiorica SM1 TaxID=1265738 RepID=M5S8C4_9BACT|nr:Serine/threonine protein kinase domain protein [Rhodopirellula maiorica SM1]
MNDPVNVCTPQTDSFYQQLHQHKDASFTGRLLLDESRLNAVRERFRNVGDSVATQSLGSAEPDDDFQTPLQIGRFTIRGVLGVGGFSTVYRAHDEMLQREVALKSFRRNRDAATDDEDPRLFEARAAARLNHPYLVPLYEAFQDSQSVYLVSEFCEGPTLARWLKEHSEPVDPSLVGDTILRLADAIVHVHGRGLVHRDIKPQNILLQPDSTSGQPTRLSPRLTDFGLARDLFSETQDDSDERMVGTLHYMAPEQVLYSEQTHGESCDIFSLGVLTYQMLTGSLPHRGRNAEEVFESICFEKPIAPHLISRGIPRDLEAICLKCLAKDPAQRYATASELTADLNRWQQGLMVHARPRSLAERTIHAARRSPLETGLLVTVFLLIAGGAMVLANSNRRLADKQKSLQYALADIQIRKEHAIRQEYQTRLQRDRAKEQERIAIQTAYHSDLRYAYSSLASKSPAKAIQIAESIERFAAGVIPIGDDLRLLKSQASNGWLSLAPHTTQIRDVLILKQSDRGLVVSEDGVIRIHRLDNAELSQEFVLPDDTRVYSVAVTADETLMAVGKQIAEDGEWLETRNEVEFIRLDGSLPPEPLTHFPTTIQSLAFSPDNSRIAVGCRYEPIQIFSVHPNEMASTNVPVVSIEAPRRNHDITFTQDGKQLLMLKQQNTPRLVHVDAPSITDEFGLGNLVYRMALSKDGRYLVCTFSDVDDLHFFDLESPNRKIRLEQAIGNPNCVAISDQGDQVVAGFHNGTIITWDLSTIIGNAADETADHPSVLDPTGFKVLHNGTVTEISIDDRGRILSGGEDGSVAISLFREIVAPSIVTAQYSTDAALTHDGKTALLACANSEVLWIDTKTLQINRVQTPRLGELPMQIKVSPNDHWLSVGYDNGNAQLVNLLKPTVSYSVLCPECETDDQRRVQVDFGFDGNQMLVSSDRGYVIKLCELPPVSSEPDDADNELVTVGQLRLPVDHRASLLHRTNHCLLLGEYIGEFRFDEGDGNVVSRGVNHFRAVCTDHATKRIFSAAFDGRIRLHDWQGHILETGNRWESGDNDQRRWPEMTAITITPDCESLLTGGHDGSIAIWNSRDLRFIGTLVPANNLGPITNIAFADDARLWMYHQRMDDPDQPQPGLKIQWIQ